MSSLEAFHRRLGLWLDPDEHLMAFDDTVNCSPVTWQVVLMLDSPSSPRRMLLFEYYDLMFQLVWNQLRRMLWSRFLWCKSLSAITLVCFDPSRESSSRYVIDCADIACLLYPFNVEKNSFCPGVNCCSDHDAWSVDAWSKMDINCGTLYGH